MFKSYLVFTIRSLKKKKVSTLINITGLTIALTVSLFIFQYVKYEYSYDKFWKESNNIYRVCFDKYQNGELSLKSARSLKGVGQTISEEIPEVKSFVQMHRDVITVYNDESQIEDIKMFATDSMFSTVFKLNFINATSNNPLKNLFSAVISKSAANKLFGSENPIGKWFKVNEGWEFMVTGVFADLPQNTHMPFDLLLSIQTYRYYISNWDYASGTTIIRNPNAHILSPDITRWSWGWNGAYTYILTNPNSDQRAIESKIAKVQENYTEHITQNNGDINFYLQPLQRIHLDSNLEYEISSNGNQSSLIALIVIAIIILCITWINFVNLSMVQYLERAKEIGIRKVIGALRSQILLQLFIESIMINLIAAFLAFIIVAIANNNLSEYSIFTHTLNLTENLLLFLTFSGIFILGSSVSAFLPAYIQSSHNPIDLFMGQNKIFVKNNFKQVFVTLQIAASIILIIGSILVYKQVNFMKNMELGLNIDQVLITHSPMTQIKNPQRINKIQTFKSEIAAIPGVSVMSTSSTIPSKEILWSRDDVRKSKEDNIISSLAYAFIDEHYIDTYKLNIVAGRNFRESKEDDLNFVIVNEKAMKKLGFTSPIDAVNQPIYVGDNQAQIVGVIKDFHQRSLKYEIDPIIFFNGYRWNHDVGYFSIKVSSKNISKSIESIEETWQNIYPGDHFNYSFLNEAFDQQYKNDQQFGKVFGVFTFIAIFIASMGLLAIVSQYIKKKTKEIGIRKILGESVTSILVMLSRKFVIWVLIANIIAWPIAYYLADLWLQNFAYKTEISWWIFAIAGSSTLTIAILTIFVQSYNAAIANPVDSLRSE